MLRAHAWMLIVSSISASKPLTSIMCLYLLRFNLYLAMISLKVLRTSIVFSSSGAKWHDRILWSERWWQIYHLLVLGSSNVRKMGRICSGLLSVRIWRRKRVAVESYCPPIGHIHNKCKNRAWACQYVYSNNLQMYRLLLHIPYIYATMPILCTMTLSSRPICNKRYAV